MTSSSDNVNNAVMKATTPTWLGCRFQPAAWTC